jgi:hypothetical protein
MVMVTSGCAHCSDNVFGDLVNNRFGMPAARELASMETLIAAAQSELCYSFLEKALLFFLAYQQQLRKMPRRQIW